MTKTQPPMSEQQLQRAVLARLKLYGWKVAHFGRAQGRDGRWLTPTQADGKGFPDLVCVRPRERLRPIGLLFIELKARGRKPSPEQREWLSLLDQSADTGVMAIVVDPRDLDDGYLDAILK